MARARIHEDIRRLVKDGEFNEASLLELLTARGEGVEGRKAIQELLLSGDLISQLQSGGKHNKWKLRMASDVRERERPLVLRPRLDMSKRIYDALSRYRKANVEVSREELKALCKQVYAIENFTPADYESHFAFGLQRAIACGKIEIVEGPKYRLSSRKKELLKCKLCDGNVHTKMLECANCRWQRHASCMGLRKHSFPSGDWECERCASCAECGRESSAWNPLAWCCACFRPVHARPCDEQGEIAGEEAPPLVQKCVACGGKQLDPSTPPRKKEETESFSPLSQAATCSSASSTTAAGTAGGQGGAEEMATPGSDKSKLSDSLSAYFTPSCEGRRRQYKQINIHEDSTSDDEPPDDRATRHMRPLTVEVSGEAGSGMASKTPPSSASSSHHHHKRPEEQLQDALSPYFSATTGKRRSAVKGEYARMQGGAENGSMERMLSPGAGPSSSSQQQSGALFSPRRSRGRPPRNSSLGFASPAPSSTRGEEEVKEEEEEDADERSKMASSSSPRKSNGHGSSPSKKRGAEEREELRLQGRNTQNSASAALFSPPDDERRRSSKGGPGKGAGYGRNGYGSGREVKRESDSDGGPRRASKSSRQLASSAVVTPTPKSPAHKRIKREIKSSEEETSQLDTDGTEDSDDKPLMRRAGVGLRTPSTAAAAATPSTSRGEEKRSSKKQIKEEPRRSGPGSSRKDATARPPQSPIESLDTGAGSSTFEATCGDVKITAEQWAGYEACTRRANEGIEKTELLSADGSEIPRWPETICFGKWEMETWFTAPYPNEYSHTKRLFICEFCLKYMRTQPQLLRHAAKCKSRRPPGKEIYRKDGVSVYEVDGNLAGMYCQNLCLLAKLYLDHKTLYYDVEPFLFYIVTKNDETGHHLVGYFSKEKYSAQKFNLSCIVTLPCYHKQGFGRFLIDFSYLLTRRENMVGTPERPLSDLGRVSYAAYWKSALLEYMRKIIKIERRTDFKLSDIAVDTGISLYDAVEVMEALGMLVKSENNGGIEFLYKEDLVEAHWKKAQANKERIWIDESRLQWNPMPLTPSKDFGAARSPPRMVSPTPSHHGITPSGVPMAACGSTIKRGPLAAANAGPAGAAAHAPPPPAGAVSPRRKHSAPSTARANEKKSATRQLKLADFGIIASPKATSTPARKSRRIAVASEDSSLASTSSEDEKKPDSKSTCKPDTKRRNRRSEDSDSSDDEREGGGATPKKRPTAPPPPSTSNGRRASTAGRGAAATPASPPKGRKRGVRRESDDDEEGEVSSAYATTSSSSESESDLDTSFRPSSSGKGSRRPSTHQPAPSKGKKGSKGGKPTPNIPRKGKAAPQKGKKNGATGVTAVNAVASSGTTLPVTSRGRKELKSPGKIFPPNYLATIASARSQQAAAAAAESAAAPGCSSAASATAAHEMAAAGGEDDGRPASPADSLCSTATIPMRQAPEAADQSMMTDDAHESEGRDHTPGPSASAMSSRPSSSVRGRQLGRRRTMGRTRRESTDEQSDSSLGGSSSASSLSRASPRPIEARIPSTSGATVNMGWDDEESDHDRTMRMEQGPQEGAAPASSSSSERPPSLQAMSPIEHAGEEEEEPQPTLGSLMKQEMARGGIGLASEGSTPLSRKQSTAAGTPLGMMMSMMRNGVGKPGPSGLASSSASSTLPLAPTTTAAASSTDDSEDEAPPCLSPQYARGEGEGESSSAAGCAPGSSRGGDRRGGEASEDGGASSDASAAPILAPSNMTRSISLDHTPAASSSSVAPGGSGGSHGVIGIRRISEQLGSHQQQGPQSCAMAAASGGSGGYGEHYSPPKTALPHADQLLSVRAPAMDVGVSHQELNFGMAPHSLHGRLSGGEGGPGPPGPGNGGGAQTSPHLQQSPHHLQMQQLQQQQSTPMMMTQHTTPQMMAYPGSASGGGMQSTPGSVPSSSAHNTPESMLGQGQTTPLMQQQQQQMQMQQQQFASPTMQQQMYSQQPSSVHSTNSGHHDMSGGAAGAAGGGPGSVPAGYGHQIHQGGHSNPSTPLRAMGGPGSANQPPFNSPTPAAQPMSVPDHHQAVAAAQAAAAAAAPAIAGRRSSEAASGGAPATAAGAAAASAAATKKRSSAGAAAPPHPSPLAAQQQQQQAQQQFQMQMQMMAMQGMYMNNPYQQQMWASNPFMQQQWANGATAQFQQMGYPNGMMMPAAGPSAGVKNGVVAPSTAAAAALYQYPATAMQHMHQPMQQHQQRPGAATAQWQTNPAFGQPFPGPGAAPTFQLPALHNLYQPASHPTFPQQY